MNAPHLHNREPLATPPAPPEPLWKSALAVTLWAVIATFLFILAGLGG